MPSASRREVFESFTTIAGGVSEQELLKGRVRQSSRGTWILASEGTEN